MKACVFFDRDGIVNRSPGPGYVEKWADFELMPGFAEVLAVVRKRGYEAVIVTNQRGVSRGIMTMEAVDEIHENLRKTLKADDGLDLLDIMCCPHGHGECTCRKPQPGMLLEAAKRHNIDLKRSWMIGDSASDIEAGKAAGCRTILVGKDASSGTKADHYASDMNDLKLMVKKLL